MNKPKPLNFINSTIELTIKFINKHTFKGQISFTDYYPKHIDFHGIWTKYNSLCIEVTFSIVRHKTNVCCYTSTYHGRIYNEHGEIKLKLKWINIITSHKSKFLNQTDKGHSELFPLTKIMPEDINFTI